MGGIPKVHAIYLQTHTCMLGSKISDTLVVKSQDLLETIPLSKGETYAKDLIAFAELATQVSRSSSQDEGDEDAFTIFTPHNIEAEASGAPLHANPAGLAGVVILSQHAAGDGRVAAW